MNSKAGIALWVSFLLVSAAARAALGPISVSSGLGQPFSAVVSLTDAGALSPARTRVGLASQATFDEMNIDFDPAVNSLRFALATGPGGPVVVVRSQKPIRLQYLQFVLQLTGPGANWVRAYTVRLDVPSAPPAPARPAVPARPAAAPVPAAPATGGRPSSPPGTIRAITGDTLASLGHDILKPGVSYNQAMASLFLANPDKFSAQNPYLPIPGALLKVPPKARMRALSEARAREILRSPRAQGPAAAAKPAPAPAPAPAPEARAAAPVHEAPGNPAPQPAGAATGDPAGKSAVPAADSPEVRQLQQQVADRDRELKKANHNIDLLKQRIRKLEASQIAAAHALPFGLQSGNPRLLGGVAGGVVALLLGLFWWRRRRRARQNPVRTAPSFGGLSTTGVAPPDPAAAGAEGSGDPLAEAEVYLAYGHEDQAEKILRDALDAWPDRQDIRAKLLELYAARPDPLRFGTLARQVYDAYDGRGAAWERTRAMGAVIDPDNPLYSPEGPGDEPPAPESMLDLPLPDGDAVSPDAAAVAAAQDKPDNDLLDFSFSIDTPAVEPVPAEPLIELPPEPAPDMPPEPAIELPLTPIGDPVPDAAPEAVPAAEAEPEAAVAPEAEPAMVWPDEPAPPAEPVAPVGAESAPVADGLPADPATDPLPPDEAAGDGPEVESVSHARDADDAALATKLDLAQVYLDMGDQEGAREVLQELLQEARGGLKQRAEDMLARLMN